MRTAIFPSYFHGKCLDAEGETPHGCPNPDCPVVCGTPGSMVHFYSVLKDIVYNTTRTILVKAAADVYEKGCPIKGKGLKSREDAAIDAGRLSRLRFGTTNGALQETTKREAVHCLDRSEMEKDLEESLDRTCGGIENGLPRCSWTKDMKAFILTFT
jgi:hypothetical protein